MQEGTATPGRGCHHNPCPWLSLGHPYIGRGPHPGSRHRVGTRTRPMHLRKHLLVCCPPD
eukprot:11331219-Prorocentrum_lima.AAC.1